LTTVRQATFIAAIVSPVWKRTSRATQVAVFASGRAAAAWRSGFGEVDPFVAHRRQPASGVRTKLPLQAVPGAAPSAWTLRTPEGKSVQPFAPRTALAAALADDARRLIAEAERDGVRKGP
jgi:hypothetical protein